MFSKPGVKHVRNILFVIVSLVLIAAICIVAYFHVQQNAATAPTLNPATMTADQVIVADPHPASPAPAGFRALKDVLAHVTFDAPVDWKPQYLPEGDGKASMVSPDFSNPLGIMTGAYLHYSFATPPDQFVGKPAQYMALLKQGMTWSDTTLDGHLAYLSINDDGYYMVVSQFSDDLFVTVAFADPGKKYGSAFDEFIKSFHVR